jgi:gliding motility-associated-like protein
VNNNAPGTQYRLERSNNGVTYSPVATIVGASYQDSGLVELVTYYYRVRAINNDGIFSAPSSTVSVYTSVTGDNNVPAAPAGLKGYLDPSARVFSLTWEPTTLTSTGDPLSNLIGYYIYKRETLSGPANRVTPNPISTTAFADRVNGALSYYTVHAVTQAGIESADSMIADSSPDANIIYISSDGVSHVMMPDTVNDLLRSAFNKYGVPLTLRLSEQALPADSIIVRNVRIELVRTDTNQAVADLAFAQPQATVAVGYGVAAGQVTRGAPASGNSRGPAMLGVTPQNLSLYWFNGVTWVRIGGKLDALQQVIKTKSSYLGSYQLRAQGGSTSLALSQGNVYPRLFSPNGDGLNDRVYFILENPNNAQVSGEIFDKNGRHVRNLPPAAQQSGIGTTLSWDGKDNQGVVVPGGAYIYKITGEDKTFTGSVGVAR